MFPDPYEFNPQRFLDNAELKNYVGYMPFSLGSRLCPGRNLAFTEMKLITANLLQNFDWTSPDGKVDVTESKIVCSEC